MHIKTPLFLLAAATCGSAMVGQSTGPLPAISDVSNEFMAGVRRFVGLSHNRWQANGHLWLSSTWTYAPDGLDQSISYSRILFGHAESEVATGSFLLTLTATRGDADPLESVDILFPGVDQRVRDSMACTAMGGHPIDGGRLATYACRIAKDEMTRAKSEGLTLRHRHASGHTYTLGYPAEFFRAIHLGTDPSAPVDAYGKRLLGYILTGSKAAPSDKPSTEYDAERARRQDEAASSFMFSLGDVLLSRDSSKRVGRKRKQASQSGVEWKRRALSQRVSLELGEDWSVIEEGVLATLNARAPKGVSHAKFGATLYGPLRTPRCSVYLYADPLPGYGQDDVLAMTREDLRQLSDSIGEDTRTKLRKSGASMLSWMGVARVQLDGALALVTTYTRTEDSQAQSRLVRLVRVYDGEDSFSLSITSYGCSSVASDLIGGRVFSSLRVKQSEGLDPRTSSHKKQQDATNSSLRSSIVSGGKQPSATERRDSEQERYELRGHNGWAMMKLGDKLGGLEAIELLANKGVTYLTTSEGLALLRKHGIATEYWASPRARLHCQGHSQWLDEETRKIWEVQKKAKKNGWSTEWHATGAKAAAGNYKAAKKDGRWTYWDAQGNVTKTETYKNGKLVK